LPPAQSQRDLGIGARDVTEQFRELRSCVVLSM
jgi:hypothetical protein